MPTDTDYQSISDGQVSAECAKRVGWTEVHFVRYPGPGWIGKPRGKRRITDKVAIPRFAEEMGLARELEEEIAERGLEERYLKALIDSTGAMDVNGISVWKLAHATPRQRAIAFLLATQQETHDAQ